MALNSSGKGGMVAGSIGAWAARAVQRAAERAKLQRESNVIPVRELRAFRFDDERVDVRGWGVRSGDLEEIGVVDAMFVDVHARRVRYLGILVHDGVQDGGMRRVLVPVGVARMSGDLPRTVTLPSIRAAQLRAAPRLPNRPVTAADENATLAAYGIAIPAPSSALRYQAAIFEEERLFAPGAPDGERR